MDVASPLFPCKRSFAPSFFEPPVTKRCRYDHHQNGVEMQSTTWTLPPKPTATDNGIFGIKRSADTMFLNAKRFKRDHQTDIDGDLLMVNEETQLDEVRSLLFQKEDILEHVFGFMDSLGLQRYRAVSKLWKNCCEAALTDRQLADPVRTIQWKEIPRLVFDAKFRVNGSQPFDFFPRGAWDGACSKLKYNLQIEISGLSWNGSLRSLNLTDAYSNHLVNLITRNLNCNDGLYHDLKILIERGRVFLKLDQHWLPGTIPVRELAKLLGICRWKGLPWTWSSSSSSEDDVVENDPILPESMDE